MAVDSGSIYSEIRIKLDALRGDIQAVERNFDRIKTTSTKTANTTAASWKAGFKAMAIASAAAFAAVALAIKSSIKVFASFEQSLANVQSVARATPAEFEKLKNAAAEAGETTRFTATQAADALYYLASAGFSATQSVDALTGVLFLAGATQSDLAFTSAAVAASISQFGLAAEDSTRVANVFTAAIQGSQATMEKLAISMSLLGPVASGMGYTIEDTAGALQVLYDAGIKASTAGTALRLVLGDLANEASPTIAKLQSLGVTFDQVDPQANSLAEIIDVLAAAGLDAGDAIAVFGKEAGASMIRMLAAGGDQIREYTAAVTGTNAAAEAYAIQNDTLAGSFDRLKSVTQSTAISFVEIFAPAIRGIVDIFTKIMGVINKIPVPLKVMLAIIAVGIPTVLAAGAAWALMSAAIAGTGVAIGAILGPITLVVAGIGLITGATVLLVNALRGELDVSQDLNRVRERNEELLESTREKIDAITTATNELTQAQLEGLKVETARIAGEVARAIAAKRAAEAKLAELEAAKAAGGGWRDGTWVSVRTYEKEIEATENLIAAHQESIDTRKQIVNERLETVTAGEDMLAVIKALADEEEAAASSTGKVSAEVVDLNSELLALERRHRALGDEVDFDKERVELYRRAIENLIEDGVDPTDAALSGLLATFRELRDEYALAQADAEALKERLEAEQKAADLLAETLLTYRDRLREVGASEEELGEIEQERVAASLRAAGVSEAEIAKVVDLMEQHRQAVIDLEEEEARAEVADSKRRARKAEDLEKLAAALAEEEQRLQEAAATRIAIQRELAASEEAAMESRSEGLRSVTDAIIKYRDKIIELGMSTEELIELEREQAIASALAAGGPVDMIERLIVLINEYYDLLADHTADEEFADSVKRATDLAFSYFDRFGQLVTSLISALTNRRIAEIDRELQAELEANGLAEESTVERYQRELAEAQAAGDKKAEAEAQTNLKRAEIEEKYAKTKAQLEYKTALASWGIQIVMATAQAVQAALNAYSSTAAIPIIGAALAPAAATAAGIFGAAQVAAILASQPEPPALATGGIVLPASGGVLTRQAENDYAELDLNAGPEGAALLGQFADRIAAAISGGKQVFLLDIDGQRISEAVVSRMNDGLVRLKL